MKNIKNLTHLDLGSGDPDYCWDPDNEDQLIRLDNDPNQEPDVLHDLETPLPFPDNSMEQITLSQCLIYIKNQKQLAQEIRRILKPGGTFILHAYYWNYHNDNPYIDLNPFISHLGLTLLKFDMPNVHDDQFDGTVRLDFQKP